MRGNLTLRDRPEVLQAEIPKPDYERTQPGQPLTGNSPPELLERVKELEAATQKLRACQAITHRLATSERLTETAPAILKLLCEIFPASLANLWLTGIDKQEMRCTVSEPNDSVPRLEAFAAASRRLSLGPGSSLPGRVWVAGRPCWIPDLKQDSSFTRAEAATAAGLCSAMAFPLLVGEEFFGVIEFFASRPLKPGRALQETLTAIGIELGQFIQRQRAEEERRQLSAIVRSANQPIISVAFDGQIQSWNRGAERLYGYAPSEVIGKSICLSVPPDQRRQMLAYLDQVRLGAQVEVAQSERVRPDGRRFWVAMALSPLKGPDGQPVGVSLIERDVTQEKVQEELNRHLQELETENRRIAAASQMKSEFLASLSHELRTALNGIIGFSEFLSDGKAGALNARQHEYLGDILSSGRHLLQLVNNILDLSKVEAGRMEVWPESFSLAQVLDEVMTVIRPLALRRDITIQCRVELEPPAITLDRVKLKQILYNFLTNAVKFNHDHGLVEVSASPLAGQCFQLSFRDTGIGMSAAELKSLFQEFHQLRMHTRPQEGTGLGLAVTRKLVELMRGTIQVESVPGQGSTFTVRLPRHLARSALIDSEARR